MNKAQISEAVDPLAPLAVLMNALQHWWIIAALIVLGALGGLLLNVLNPPLYESSAQFSVSIDYAITGTMTQYDEDLAINAAGGVFVAPDVLQKVADQAVKEGIQTSFDALRKQIFIDRTFSVWTIRVRDRDPLTAKRLAGIWLSQGESTLKENYRHAVQAYWLDRYIQTQETCLESAWSSAPSAGACDLAHFKDVQQNLRDAGEALFQERQASRAIFYGLAFGPFNPPEGPAQMVTPDRNRYVLLGGLIGLIAGVTLVETGAIRRAARIFVKRN